MRLCDAFVNPAKHLIFISHANPENNDFAQWLALQLACRGYAVWCDVTKLIGGEKFWQDIEEAIQKYAVKFLLCASKQAITKPGVLRELNLALKAESEVAGNFIIPLKLDEVAFGDLPHNLGSTTNAIRFDLGWAGGLKATLEMLERDGVSISTGDGTQRVNDWWREHYPITEGVFNSPDLHFSNIFPVSSHPEHIWFHPVSRRIPKKLDKSNIGFPVEPYSNGFISFVKPTKAVPGISRFGFDPKKSVPINLKEFIENGNAQIKIESSDAQRRVYSLIRQAFAEFRTTKKLQSYALANEAECYWLKLDTLKNDEAEFVGIDGKKHGRALVGYKNFRVTKEGVKNVRYWHFAVQVRPIFVPSFAICFRSHVVFTDDGASLIDSTARQHTARRSQCSSWWNDTWRDRLLAMVGHLADGTTEFRIPLCESDELVVCSSPLQLTASRAYKIIEPQKIEQLPVEPDVWDNSDDGEEADNVVT